MARRVIEGERIGDVWVHVEQEAGQAHPVSWELMGVARKLADQINLPLWATILGHKIAHLAEEAVAYGADKVLVIDDPVLENYRTAAYQRGMVQLVRKYRSCIYLVGGTTLGRDLAGAVATELLTGLTADSTVLDVDAATKQLLATRPTFGGNQLATIVTPDPKHCPQMATVRPRIFPMPEKDGTRKGEITEETLGMAESEVPTRLIDFIAAGHRNNLNLEYADIIVSGGRGLGNREGFQLMEEFAKEIGGVVGASRAVVDAGWISNEHQVGLTGKTVRPKIYFACGISGAIQHLVGMKESDVVVAINTDPSAQIFQYADFQIVGDLYEVVPALLNEVRSRKGSASVANT